MSRTELLLTRASYPFGPRLHRLLLGDYHGLLVSLKRRCPTVCPPQSNQRNSIQASYSLLQSSSGFLSPQFWQVASKALHNGCSSLRSPPTTSQTSLLLRLHFLALVSLPQDTFPPHGHRTDCYLGWDRASQGQMAPSPPLRLCSVATFSVKPTVTTLFKNASPDPIIACPPYPALLSHITHATYLYSV